MATSICSTLGARVADVHLALPYRAIVWCTRGACQDLPAYQISDS